VTGVVVPAAGHGAQARARRPFFLPVGTGRSIFMLYLWLRDGDINVGITRTETG